LEEKLEFYHHQVSFQNRRMYGKREREREREKRKKLWDEKGRVRYHGI
jgi:hypothetical protein